MEYLKQLILDKGKIVSSGIIDVTEFLNSAVDIKLLKEVTDEFYNYYKDKGITKVLTIETSGVPFATALALRLGVDLLVAKKTSGFSTYEALTASVFSYTKEKEYVASINEAGLKNSDNIVIIDDILANGSATLALLKIAKYKNTNVAGVGVVIEKTFQKGRIELEAAGVDVFSLIKINNIDVFNNKVDME